MKNLSKALALFVVVAMMLTSVMSVAAFTDVDNGSTYARAINVDTALGLLNGYPDGTFQPEGSITRAEFAAVVVRMLGQEAQVAGSASVTPYADVAADHWAAGYINIATQLGIINGYGDGNFGPEDPVLYEQAVKMVVIALGYGPVCDANAYPVSYLTKAGQIGITTGLKGENGANANRGLVAQIVFNALDKPLMKETGYGLLTSYEVCDGSNDTTKATILDEYLDTVKILATVSDNSSNNSSKKTEKVKLTVLNAYKNRYGDEAGEEFAKNEIVPVAVGSTNASEFVGKKAIVYINYIDGYLEDAVITYIEEDSSTTTTSITSDQYEAISPTAVGFYKVEYRENSSDRNTQSFLVSPTAPIYVNGEEVGKATEVLETKLASFYGKADFSLNNSSKTDADYDTVFITDYKTIVVDAVNTRTSRVTAKNASSLQFANPEDTIKATLYDANGDVMDWADLEEFDVISYTINADKDKITAYVVDNSITGKVDGQSGDEYTINGKDYTLAKGFTDISMSDEGTFYLDIMGNIVYFDESIGVSGGKNYAYVASAKVVSDFEDALRLKLFTADGKTGTYELYSKVRYNDGTAEEVIDSKVFAANANKGENAYTAALTDELIAYKVNTSGLITAIELPKAASFGSKTEKRSDFIQYTNEVTATYDKDTDKFEYPTSKKVFATDSTEIFIIGENKTEEADFDIISLSSINDGSNLLKARFYNVDDDNNAGIIVATKYEPGDLEKSAISIAVSKGETQDEDGATINSIKAFSELDKTTYLTEDTTTITVPENGSVFIPEFKSGSTLKSIDLVVKTTGSTVALQHNAKTDDVNYIFGNINAVSTKGVVTLEGDVDYKIPANANVYVVDGRQKEKNRVSVEDINYLEYDEDGKEWTDGTNDKVTSYVMFAREVDSKITDVVLYVNYTK